jgi:hypothetical protein
MYHLPPFLAAFEAFHNGSWHGVSSVKIRNGSLSAKFVYSGSTVEHIVDGDYLRIHSRRATCYDCSHFLKPGVDVCVWQATSTGQTEASVCHFFLLFYIISTLRSPPCSIIHMTVSLQTKISISNDHATIDSNCIICLCVQISNIL